MEGEQMDGGTYDSRRGWTEADAAIAQEFRRKFLDPAADSPYAVTFLGHPDFPPEGRRVAIPVSGIDEISYICVGEDEHDHYVRDEDEPGRVFHYVGPCATVEGEHAYPGARHGHG